MRALRDVLANLRAALRPTDLIVLFAFVLAIVALSGLP